MSTRQLRSAARSKATTRSPNGGPAANILPFKRGKASSSAVSAKVKGKEQPASTVPRKRPISPSSSLSPPRSPPTTEAKKGSSNSPKRQKLSNHLAGTTPFPDHPHPTPAEVQVVVDLLSEKTWKVPSVLDALIRTLLSASTTAQNSNRAFRGLVEAFGICGKKGSVDWEKVRKASEKEVYEAIKGGGLANVKSKRIKRILDQVWEEAQVKKKQRQEKAMKGEEQDDDTVVVRKGEDGNVVKQEYHGHQLVSRPWSSESPSEQDNATPNHIATSEYEFEDDLSLDYLHTLPDTEAMSKLTSFEGIGFKTASCVLLFCMSRESFAVDTHVFRLARFLNWVPPDKATRETAFWHLDAKLPGEHKYALHQLFIKHGRECLWCKAGGPLTYEDAVSAQDKKLKKREKVKVKKEKGEEGEEDTNTSESGLDMGVVLEKCPIEHLVKRFHGASKGKGVKWEAELGAELQNMDENVQQQAEN
ncbi:DNA glycosylase [Kalaharituber pfeilii]|nr:DNA glycosylase [Kalaharituber pfeilii]